MVTKRVTFRLYPNKSQEAKMHYWRRLHKDLYNACLAQRKSEYKHYGNNVTYFDQQNCLPAFKQQWYEYKTRKAKQGKRKRQKSGLNRSILDVGIGALKSMIAYKVTEAGGIYIEIPTRKVKPSQTCPKCGHKKKKDLSERVHHCEHCGFTTDRDTAAAMVMRGLC